MNHHELRQAFNLGTASAKSTPTPTVVEETTIFPICFVTMEVDVIIKSGLYHALTDVHNALKISAEYTLFALTPDANNSTYIRCKSLADIVRCWKLDPKQPVRLTSNFAVDNAATTLNVCPTKTTPRDQEVFDECVPEENYIPRKMHKFLGRKVPVVHEDHTLEVLRRHIRNTRQLMDNEVLILTAPPGSGKSFSVEYASNTISSRVEYEREELTESLRDQAKQLAADAVGITSYIGGTCLFLPMCRQIVSDVVARATMRLKRAHKPASIVVVHFDELQMLMTHQMVREDDPQLSDNLMDYLIHAFYSIVWCYADQNESIKMVLTGTNFFAPLAVTVLSFKYETIELSGSFSPEWLYSNVFHPYFGYYCDSHADKEVIMECLETVSANRRCAERFLLLFNQTEKDFFLGAADRAPFHLFLRYCADQAYREWSAAVALPETCAGCEEIFTLLVCPEVYQCKVEKQSDGEETFSFPRANVSKSILECALRGVVSVRYRWGDWLFQKPRGVVWRFLFEQCTAHKLQRKKRKKCKNSEKTAQA